MSNFQFLLETTLSIQYWMSHAFSIPSKWLWKGVLSIQRMSVLSWFPDRLGFCHLRDIYRRLPPTVTTLHGCLAKTPMDSTTKLPCKFPPLGDPPIPGHVQTFTILWGMQSHAPVSPPYQWWAQWLPWAIAPLSVKHPELLNAWVPYDP